MVRKLDNFGEFKWFDADAYKRRLRIMREIISGDNQTDFAKRLGIDFKRWSNYERGYPVPREVAWKLYEKFPGMSIEWLWYGSKTSLSNDYRDKIAIAEKMEVEYARDVAEMEKLRNRLNASAEARRKALHPGKPRPKSKTG
jgi:transcriptional regulator with XRE-family HTH domain